MSMAAVLLSIAIVIEVGATALLPRTDGLTQPGWATVTLLGYAVSIGLLALVVRTMPVSITYAVWSGAGTALVAVISVLFLHERLTLVQVLCLGLVIVGVVGLNLAGSHPGH